ncbi:MAG: helix-turn-helix domain-containing protein [Planctomycetota bacterium]|nr:helix-turn-helix domain-containing protein [Planctomycetota bacterium]
MADFYSMEEAARVLGISLDELKKKIQSGELKQVAGGHAPQLRKTEVEEFARRQGLGSDPDVQSDLSFDDLDFNDIFLGQGESDLGAHTVGIAKSDIEAALKPVAPESKTNPLGVATGSKPGESDIQIVRVAPQGASDSDVRISPTAGRPGPSDSDVTLLASESVELDLGDLSPLVSSGRTQNTAELGSSGEIPLIDADSDFDLSPSGVIDALQPESGSDFELTALDSSSEFEVPGTLTASAVDVSNKRSGSGVNLAKPNDSGIGLANFDADSIELSPIDDAPPPKAAPGKPISAAPAKSAVKPVAASKPSDTGMSAAISAFDDTDFELDDVSGALPPASVGDKTVQIEANSDFEIEQSEELSMISEPMAAMGSGLKLAKPAPADDASSEWDISGSGSSDSDQVKSPSETKSSAKPSPALVRASSTEWGTPWVVGLGISTVMMLLLCMVAFDLVKNLYEFRGETPVSSGLIKQVAGLLGK